MASSSSAASPLVTEQLQQQSNSSETVFSWLKGLPTAPEYHPTLAEFQDPISYIFKIENEASKYGICKIVPPVPPNPKKTAITNLNRSLAARAGTVYNTRCTTNLPTFTTRQQQIGFCPRKPRPVQRPVWESGEFYTFQQFEAKAKSFEKSYLKKSVKKVLSPLEIETLYWKASVDKPFSVEYANDMPGSAFNVVNSKKCREAGEDAVTLGETAWNMRGVSRAKGSLLRCMKEEIPGVTSPMVYVAMMFSWFAWHVEDHDLHSLNYMHMGGGKTWYGVPREAAYAFEEVVRVHGYGGEINPLVTFATLGEKTTVMSPEVFINAGIPCCRLVQNPGEFVVTFPRAYHSGFSHGFNCGEAANIATPEWLKVAKDAAIRRASINYPPMVSHIQLLYDLAMALSSRLPMSVSAEPRSSRLKQKKKGEGEVTIKELFVQNVIQNNDLLHNLGEGSSVVMLPRSCLYSSVSSSSLHAGSQVKAQPKLYLGLSNQKETMKELGSLISNGITLEKNKGFKELKGYFSTEETNASLCENYRGSSLRGYSERDAAIEGDILSGGQKRLFSCATCGTLSYACIAIVQPSEAAARYLMSADCSVFSNGSVGSGVSDEEVPVTKMNDISGRMVSNSDGLYEAPVQSSEYEVQGLHQDNKVISDIQAHEDPSALGLLALNYGDSSESDDDRVEQDSSDCDDKTNGGDGSSQNKNFTLSPLSEDFDGGSSPTEGIDHYEENRNRSSNFANRSYQINDCHSRLESEDLASVVTNISECTFTDLLTNSNFSKPILQHENANKSFTQRSQDDSCRMHVFCLEHAAEVEQKLRSIGGAQILLLCHPDYPSVETEAKLVAEELGIDHLWSDTTFRDATREDEEWIQSALNSEEAVPGNGDWSVKMGINLYFSAILSRSPLYSKQMPYNPVIYNAFGCDSPSKSPSKPKVFFGKRPTRKKKIILAGKWCGKVWMTNQVHPLLVPKEPDEQGQVHERNFIGASSKLQLKPETTPKPEIIQYYRKTGRKRKIGPGSRSGSGLVKKAKAEDFNRDSDNSAGDCPPQQEFRSIKKAKCRAFEEEDPTSEREDSPSREVSPPLISMLRSKRTKKETPPQRQKKSEKNFTKFGSYSDDDLEGGPSTRLRKRKAKVEKDPEPKPVAKKAMNKRKMKKTPASTSSYNNNVKIKDEDHVPKSRKVKDEGVNYQCDLEGCEMAFGSKQELILHKRNICPVRGCGKKFFSHKYLVQHRRVHNDDRPLKCPWRGCKMTFKWAWARTEHIRVHTGARPYVCGQAGCGQTFRFVSDFSRHKRKTGHLSKKKTKGI